MVASLLKPGGRIILIDEHPILSCLWVENGQLQIIDDYFRRAEPMEVRGWYHFKGGEDARETKFEFTWPVSDVITSLIHAGLTIEQFIEYPGGPDWRLCQAQGKIDHLPGHYLVVARKTGEQR